MACDTFLKIAQKLKRKFVMVRFSRCGRCFVILVLVWITQLFFSLNQPQQGESTAFIYDLCENLPATIVDLEIHQVCMQHKL